MKTNYLIFLLILVAPFNLAAQKTICGIKVGEFNLSSTQAPMVACDTIFSFATIDDWPGGLAFDGSYFYSSGHNTHVIDKYTITGQFADTIPLPGISAGDLDFDGTYLWMVSEQDRTVYKMNATNGNIITSFLLPTSSPGDPNNFGCAYDNGYIWTTEYGDETLMRINAATGTLVDSFAIHRWVIPLKIINGSLYGIEFVDKTPYGSMQLDKFDKATGSVIDSVQWCLPYSLGLTWARNHVWGLSSGAGVGTSHIYEFGSIFNSIDNAVPLKNNISVFPNPASTHVTIYTPQKSEIEILNLEGQTIKNIKATENNTTIDISEFPVGMYLIKVKTDKESVVEKLIKE